MKEEIGHVYGLATWTAPERKERALRHTRLRRYYKCPGCGKTWAVTVALMECRVRAE